LFAAQALKLAPTEWSNESLQGFALHRNGEDFMRNDRLKASIAPCRAKRGHKARMRRNREAGYATNSVTERGEARQET
jgi:hypothetical protein